jgi:uracil-DNA glycosylase
MIDFNQKTAYEALSYEELATTCRSCTKCVLHETRTNVVVGSGPVPCDIMIIGEGPGEQEDLQALPFVGKSGQLLTKILESVSIDRNSQVFIGNTVKCRPPKNRTPLPSEIEACKPYLIRQIQLVKPKILLLLGSPALKTILEENLPISQVRGQWYKATVNYMEEPLYIMTLFHPSYLLRNQSKEKGSPKWLTWQDIQEVKTALSFYES